MNINLFIFQNYTDPEELMLPFLLENMNNSIWICLLENMYDSNQKSGYYTYNRYEVYYTLKYKKRKSLKMYLEFS